MQRNIVIASGLVCAIVFILLIFAFRTPHYAGKSVDHWMTELTSTNETVRTNAVVAIRALGKDVIPTVLRRVKARRSVWHSNTQPWVWLTRVGLPLSPPPTTGTLYKEAREALWALGTSATAAIPGLTALLSNPATADRACSLLQEMNNEVIPALVIATTNANSKVRQDTIIDLGRRRMNTPEVVEALCAALISDPVPANQVMAALALGRVPDLPDTAIGSLVNVLDDPNAPENLLISATQALGEQGPRAKAAVPVLVRMIQHPNPVQNAKFALTQIDPETAEKHGVKVKLRTNPFE